MFVHKMHFPRICKNRRYCDGWKYGERFVLGFQLFFARHLDRGKNPRRRPRVTVEWDQLFKRRMDIYHNSAFAAQFVLEHFTTFEPRGSAMDRAVLDVLASLELDVFQQSLEQLGVRSCMDVTYLMDEDLKQIGLNLVQVRKLQFHIGKTTQEHSKVQPQLQPCQYRKGKALGLLRGRPGAEFAEGRLGGPSPSTSKTDDWWAAFSNDLEDRANQCCKDHWHVFGDGQQGVVHPVGFRAATEEQGGWGFACSPKGSDGWMMFVKHVSMLMRYSSGKQWKTSCGCCLSFRYCATSTARKLLLLQISVEASIVWPLDLRLARSILSWWSWVITWAGQESSGFAGLYFGCSNIFQLERD